MAHFALNQADKATEIYFCGTFGWLYNGAREMFAAKQSGMSNQKSLERKTLVTYLHKINMNKTRAENDFLHVRELCDG